MSDLFFYGRFCHVPLLECVLGRPVGGPGPIWAELPDHAVFAAQGQPLALLQGAPGAPGAPGTRARGVLLRAPGDDDLARLVYYHRVMGYELHPVTVRTDAGPARARMFRPEPGRWQAGPPWSQPRWQEEWGAICVRAAVEVMAHCPGLDPTEVARRLFGIRIRAAAWVAARDRAPDPGDDPARDPARDVTRDVTRDVVVHAHHRPYSNFFAAEEMDLQYRRYDGRLSPVLNRGAQVLGQAVVVLPFDPVRDAVLLVQQFRTPVFIGGDPAPWIWEPVSGLIDPGEVPEQSARREALEEAGLTIGRLERVGGAYSSSGANSEFVHLYVGLGDFCARAKGGGLAAEGEDIRVGIVPFADLIDRVDRGQYRDMPLVLTALWLARHRDRLRATA